MTISVDFDGSKRRDDGLALITVEGTAGKARRSRLAVSESLSIPWFAGPHSPRPSRDSRGVLRGR